jgi:hypothetical protein
MHSVGTHSARSSYTSRSPSLFYRHIRDRHPELHERFGGHRVWFSMPDQLRFFGFLFAFRYFQEHDTTLSILALLMQLTGVVAAYLILAQPIYYSWHS